MTRFPPRGTQGGEQGDRGNDPFDTANFAEEVNEDVRQNEQASSSHEPSRAARPREEAQEERATRRRLSPATGQRRPREPEHLDNDEPPRTSRRLQAIECAIADVVTVKAEY